MALKEQIVPIPLGGSPEEGGGLREGVDSKLVNAPYLLDLQNGELGKDGSVRRRRPADQMLQTGLSARALQNLNSVFVHEGGTLVVNTATGPHTFNDDTGWAPTGEFGQQPCLVTQQDVVDAQSYYTDSVSSGGCTLYVVQGSDGLYVTALKDDTGAVLLGRTRVVAGNVYNPKVVALPGTGVFNVCYMDAASTANLVMAQFRAQDFPSGTPHLGFATIESNVNQYDVAPGPTGFFYVALGLVGGVFNAKRIVESTHAVSGFYTTGAFGGSDGVGIWYSSVAGAVFAAAFDSSVDTQNYTVARMPAALGSLTNSTAYQLKPAANPTPLHYKGFVATFAHAGDTSLTGDVLLVVSTVCYFFSNPPVTNTFDGSYYTGIQEGAFGQHGCMEMRVLNFDTTTDTDLRPEWGYYAVTKAWNPLGSTSRPMWGAMRLNTAGAEYGLGGPPLQEYQRASLESSILVCSFGMYSSADAGGYDGGVCVVGRTHDDVATNPDIWNVTYGVTQDSSVPSYYSRLSQVAVDGTAASWSRSVYSEFSQQPIEPQSSVSTYFINGLKGTVGGVRRCVVESKPGPMRSCATNGLTTVCGGYVGAFDGTNTYESSFHAYPEVIDGLGFQPFVPGTAGGFNARICPVWRLDSSLTPALGLQDTGAVVNMQFVYCWEDSYGRLHRSAPSDAYQSVAVSAGGFQNNAYYYIDAYITDFPPSAIQTEVERRYIEVYVSGNVVSNESISDPPVILTASAKVTPTDIDESMHFAMRVDYDPYTQRDTQRPWLLKLSLKLKQLIGGECAYSSSKLLYTSGDVLESLPPPASLDAVSTSDRVWTIASNEVWPSKVLEPGIAPEFNGNLVIPMLTGSGPCVAIAALDEKVIVFKQSSIFVITGDGPNNTGGGNAFPVPQAVSTDIGCVSRASVVRGPFGLAFQSARGLYLLDRGLNLTWIGKSVEDTVGTDPVVCGVVVPGQSHVRWILDATGKAVVWNYDMNQWGVYGGSKELHGVPYQGAWVGLLDGLVLPDTTTAYFAQEFVPTTNDSGNYVQYPMPLSLTTAWIKPGSIQGFVRCRRALLLGEVGTIPGFFNAHNGLQIEAQYNYDPTTLTTYSWTPDETHVTWPNFECHLQYQRFESIRFVVSEVPIDGQLTCPGAAFSGMTLRVAVKGVPFKYFRQGDVR